MLDTTTPPHERLVFVRDEGTFILNGGIFYAGGLFCGRLCAIRPLAIDYAVIWCDGHVRLCRKIAELDLSLEALRRAA